MTTRRTEITIETSRRVVVRRLHGSFGGWCERCMAEVQMITADEAVARSGVSSQTVYQWIEAAEVHVTSRSGVLLLCAESLPRPSITTREIQ
jgi:predicted DNA-binding transcriptional regulator AlpA